MLRFKKFVFYIFFISHVLILSAQDPATNNLQPRPSIAAVAIENSPNIDGEVLTDEVWQAIEPFGNMTQAQPNFGEVATEKTEIRIAYTKEVFYISVVCNDASPNTLVVSDARRDADLTNTDAFLFILDTYKDGQNGFIFGTNSLGVEYDAHQF